MRPIDFPERNVTFAENQPEYIPLPAWKSDDGEVISMWRLSFRERLRVLLSGKLWIRTLKFNGPLQPLLPQVENPFAPKVAPAPGGAEE